MRKGRNQNRSSRKKRRSSFAGDSFKRFLARVLPVAIPLLFFGFFFFFLSKAAFNFLTRSSYFSIETVEAASSHRDFAFRDPSLMGSLLGRNIFTVSLSDLQEEVSQKHPELLAASVSREFPNRIRIHVVPRLPVAHVQSGGSFLVDREGVILPYSDVPGLEKLPVIIGIQEKLERSQVGYSLRSRALAEALDFVAILNQLPELGQYVHAIDVSDANNLSFSTPEGLEVRMGRGDYKEKLKLFDRMRVKLKSQLGDIKYLDLRFDEPVIGSR